MSNVNKPRSSFYIPCSCRRPISSPLWNHPSSTFLLLFAFFLFPGFIQRILTPSPPPAPHCRSINARFLRWSRPDWGTALPSMDTKTCRQHREQETTNCCKLRNTNARLSQPSFSSLSRAFLHRIPVTVPRSRVFSTRYVLSSVCVLASPYHYAILSLLSLKRDAIRIYVLSAAGFAYQNPDR